MKNRTNIIICGLLLLTALQAGVTADVNIADTEDYTVENGKVLIFYADESDYMTRVSINLKNLTTDLSFLYLSMNISESYGRFYIFTITENMLDNHTLVKYEVNIYTNNHPESPSHHNFAGYFSTQTANISQLVNYSFFENLSASAKQEIIDSINSPAFLHLFADTEVGITDTISSYNDGLVNELRGQGLSSIQIEEVLDSIATGFSDTLRSKQEQAQAEEDAKNEGFWYAIRLAGVFASVGIAIVIFWILKSNAISFSKLRLSKKNKTAQVEDFSDVFS